MIGRSGRVYSTVVHFSEALFADANGYAGKTGPSVPGEIGPSTKLPVSAKIRNAAPGQDYQKPQTGTYDQVKRLHPVRGDVVVQGSHDGARYMIGHG